MEVDVDENGGDAVCAALYQALDEVDAVIDRQGDDNVVEMLEEASMGRLNRY